MESPASEVLPQEQRIPRQWGTLKKEWNKLPKLTQDQKKRVKAALKFVKAKSNIERDFDLIVTVSSLRGLFGYQTPSQANSGPEEAGQGGHHVHGSQVECRKGLRRNCYRCLPPGDGGRDTPVGLSFFFLDLVVGVLLFDYHRFIKTFLSRI
jgi:hypothetical protein